jgi:hypothetical protein
VVYVGPGSERGVWACQSLSPPAPFAMKSVNGAATRDFAVLSDESVLDKLKQNIEAGKLPVIVRVSTYAFLKRRCSQNTQPWIIRLRHAIPKLDNLYRRVHTYGTSFGFTPEEDAILDRYLEQKGRAEINSRSING